MLLKPDCRIKHTSDKVIHNDAVNLCPSHSSCVLPWNVIGIHPERWFAQLHCQLTNQKTGVHNDPWKSAKSHNSQTDKVVAPGLATTPKLKCQSLAAATQDPQYLDQRSQTHGPRAACGPRRRHLQPATHYLKF